MNKKRIKPLQLQVDFDCLKVAKNKKMWFSALDARLYIDQLVKITDRIRPYIPWSRD